jgi:hypothetical protein
VSAQDTDFKTEVHWSSVEEGWRGCTNALSS